MKYSASIRLSKLEDEREDFGVPKSKGSKNGESIKVGCSISDGAGDKDGFPEEDFDPEVYDLVEDIMDTLSSWSFRLMGQTDRSSSCRRRRAAIDEWLVVRMAPVDGDESVRRDALAAYFFSSR